MGLDDDKILIKNTITVNNTKETRFFNKSKDII